MPKGIRALLTVNFRAFAKESDSPIVMGRLYDTFRRCNDRAMGILEVSAWAD